MTVIMYPVRFPHRVRATHDIEMMDGTIVPAGTLGWLVGHTHLWKEPDVEFDGFGVRGISGEDIETIRENGRLIRGRAAMSDDDALANWQAITLLFGEETDDR